MKKSTIAMACVTGLLALLARPALGEWVCWSDHQRDRIRCAKPDGSQLTDLYSNLGKPMGVALDEVNDRLYWADSDLDQIFAADLIDHASPSPLVQLPLGSGLRGMAVAPSIGKVYWVAEKLVPGVIQRANLDGTEIETLPVSPGSFYDVAVDETNRALFWVEGPRIWRGNLDGTNAVAIITDADEPYYMALDRSAGRIYWTNFGSSTIGSANLFDGSSRNIAFFLDDRPIGITIDAPSAKLYWTLDSGDVQSANLDGSGVMDTVLTTTAGTWDIITLQQIPGTGEGPGEEVPVPAVSAWGVLILTMTMLSAMTVVLSGKRGKTCCQV